MDPRNRIPTMIFASVYPLYITKVERKGRTRAEVDTIIRWLTGYSQRELQAQIDKKVNFRTLFAEAPRLNPARTQITGLICGVRVQDITDPLLQNARYLDKLIDELAHGKPMAKILRSAEG